MVVAGRHVRNEHELLRRMRACAAGSNTTKEIRFETRPVHCAQTGKDCCELGNALHVPDQSCRSTAIPSCLSRALLPWKLQTEQRCGFGAFTRALRTSGRIGKPGVPDSQVSPMSSTCIAVGRAIFTSQRPAQRARHRGVSFAIAA